jgi:long-chain fatty acid transport protein
MGVLRLVLFLCLLLAISFTGAFGSGFVFDGTGVKARGMGGAFRAVADDWSAAYYNPAGYNQIMDNMLAFNLATFHNRYWISPDVKWAGIYETGFYNEQEIPNRHEILNVPQGGMLARLPVFGNEMVMGFSIMQLFDQNQMWEMYQNIPAHTDSIIPGEQFGINLDAVAFQFTAARGFMEDKLSVGIGLSLLRGDLIYNNVALRENPMEAPVSDRPHDKIPEWYKAVGNGWGFGYRLGLLYEPMEKMKIGLTYVGKSSIDLSGTSEFKFYMGENPYITNYITNQQFEEYLFLSGQKISYESDFETSLDLPASIGGGISYQVTDRLLLAVDAEMIFWSQFEGFEFTFTNYDAARTDQFYRDRGYLMDTTTFSHTRDLIETDMAVPIAWQDAARVMVGALYKPLTYMDVRAGFGADKSSIKWDNSGGVTQIPQFFDLGTKFTYSFGLGFEIDVWTLELATSYTTQPDMDVSRRVDQDGDGLMDNITAEYKADNYQTLLGISYRF